MVHDWVMKLRSIWIYVFKHDTNNIKEQAHAWWMDAKKESWKPSSASLETQLRLRHPIYRFAPSAMAGLADVGRGWNLIYACVAIFFLASTAMKMVLSTISDMPHFVR
jgi:hypothetical protein